MSYDPGPARSSTARGCTRPSSATSRSCTAPIGWHSFALTSQIVHHLQPLVDQVLFPDQQHSHRHDVSSRSSTGLLRARSKHLPTPSALGSPAFSPKLSMKGGCAESALMVSIASVQERLQAPEAKQ